jgi:tellurite resistance protein
VTHGVTNPRGNSVIMSVARIPPNIFGMGFGLAGLATAWRVGADFGVAPAAVSNVLTAAAALVWLTSCGLYLRYAVRTSGALAGDLADQTVGPFLSMTVITPVLLAADGIAPYSRPTASVVVDVFAVLIVVQGGWFTGYWMRGGIDLDRLHPGYFLPTVAGGFVASAGAAEVGQHRLAQVMFGLGLICWLVLGSMIMARLIFRPALPDTLAPTMAIEIAPAAVASLAHFFATDGRLDAIAAALGGYGLLMVVAQVPLVPRYRRLTFTLGTWAFTFSWAAVASTVLFWIHSGHLRGSDGYSLVVLAAISLLVAGIGARTVLALARGQLLPASGRYERSADPSG